MKKIILNINEKSALFDLLFFVSSGNGYNILNKEITYKLSLLSMNKIKQKLLDIIPEFILRECSINKYNGYYSCKNNILLINEYSYFGFSFKEGEENLIKKDDIDGIYTIPLLLLFLREIFGHWNNTQTNSKIERIDSSFNYYYYYSQINGEFDRLVESFISPYKEIIFYLKYSNDKFPELLDYNKWIDSNFNELNEYITKKIIATDYKENMEIIKYPIPINDVNISEGDEEYIYEEHFIYKIDFFIKEKSKELKGCI